MAIEVFKSGNYLKETQSFLHYFGFTGIKADLDGLNRILQSFQNIPYENVSKLLRSRKCLNDISSKLRFPDRLWNEYLDHQMGGTCYSLTFFLETLLTNSGFECYPVSCDMKWGKNVHCVLVVLIDSISWLCDPGYLMMRPMALTGEAHKFYRTPNNGVKISYEGEKYHLETFNGKNIRWRYSFRDIRCGKADFVNYWLASFDHPGMNGICLTRQEKGGMLYIHNNYYRQVTPYKIKKRRMNGNWLKEIEKYFGISRSYLDEAYNISQNRRET